MRYTNRHFTYLLTLPYTNTKQTWRSLFSSVSRSTQAAAAAETDEPASGDARLRMMMSRTRADTLTDAVSLTSLVPSLTCSPLESCSTLSSSLCSKRHARLTVTMVVVSVMKRRQKLVCGCGLEWCNFQLGLI